MFNTYVTCSYYLLAIEDEDFHIKFHVRNKANNFIWSLVAVYGPAQEAHKTAFLRELVNLTRDNPHPILIGGDFNMLRYRHEKSRGRFDNHCPFLFNVVIESLDLREAALSGGQYTWANNFPIPTIEKPDRVLMTTD